MKSHAFTLAEVLITLGIIGVVAALTMPALMASYEKMVLRQQFKKNYTLISNGINQAVYDMGGNTNCGYDGDGTTEGSTNFSDCSELWSNLFANVKIAKLCKGNALINGCIPENYGDIFTNASDGCGGFDRTSITTRNYVYNTIDGTTFIPYRWNTSPILLIDVNGAHKKPNMIGRDIFALTLTSEKYGGSYRYGLYRGIYVCLVHNSELVAKQMYFKDISELLK